MAGEETDGRTEATAGMSGGKVPVRWTTVVDDKVTHHELRLENLLQRAFPLWTPAGNYDTTVERVGFRYVHANTGSRTRGHVIGVAMRSGEDSRRVMLDDENRIDIDAVREKHAAMVVRLTAADERAARARDTEAAKAAKRTELRALFPAGLTVSISEGYSGYTVSISWGVNDKALTADEVAKVAASLWGERGVSA